MKREGGKGRESREERGGGRRVGVEGGEGEGGEGEREERERERKRER